MNETLRQVVSGLKVGLLASAAFLIGLTIASVVKGDDLPDQQDYCQTYEESPQVFLNFIVELDDNVAREFHNRHESDRASLVFKDCLNHTRIQLFTAVGQSCENEIVEGVNNLLKSRVAFCVLKAYGDLQ